MPTPASIAHRLLYPALGFVLVGSHFATGDRVFALTIAAIVGGVFIVRISMATLLGSFRLWKWNHIDWTTLCLAMLIAGWQPRAGVMGPIFWPVSITWLCGALLMLWLMILARMTAHPVRAPGHCPKCNYDLRGQSTCRCPECGRAFSWGEVRWEEAS